MRKVWGEGAECVDLVDTDDDEDEGECELVIKAPRRGKENKP